MGNLYSYHTPHNGRDMIANVGEPPSNGMRDAGAPTHDRGGTKKSQPRRRLRIAILTSGRFWVCDLARELDAFGHDVKVYSYYPPWLFRQYGLPEHCQRWLGPYLAPLVLAGRLKLASRKRLFLDALTREALDRVAAQMIEPCDVFIGLAGMALHSMKMVSKKYGARLFLERGNRHILSQQAILQAAPGGMDSHALLRHSTERELKEYELADVITVPAEQVVESFGEYGIGRERLFCNPFGVSLEMFSPTPAPPPEPRRILIVAAWTARKGVDILVEGWRRMKVEAELLHVGSLDGVPLPTDEGFLHSDPVKQPMLRMHYAKAHVFALPSREEGLAMVQVQALACGVPLVCTTRTGGSDLWPFVKSPSSIRVVPPDDPDALAKALDEALINVPNTGIVRDLTGGGLEQLSWTAYARRYEAKLLEVTEP